MRRDGVVVFPFPHKFETIIIDNVVKLRHHLNRTVELKVAALNHMICARKIATLQKHEAHKRSQAIHTGACLHWQKLEDILLYPIPSANLNVIDITAEFVAIEQRLDCLPSRIINQGVCASQCVQNHIAAKLQDTGAIAIESATAVFAWQCRHTAPLHPILILALALAA